MGLALKIKAKMTPDNLKSGGSQGGETNMHPGPRKAARGSSLSSSDDGSAGHNGAGKTQTFRGHRPRDSGIEIGHDSRFIEHVDVDPSRPEQAPSGTSVSHTKEPAPKFLPKESRKPTAGARTTGVDADGGGRHLKEPAAVAPPRKVPTGEAGAFTSSKAGTKPDYLPFENPRSSTFYNHENARPSLQSTRAYKSDAIGIPKRSIVDGYGKDPSSPDSRLVMEKPSSPPGGERYGHNHEAQWTKPTNLLGVTPGTPVNQLKGYARDFEAGSLRPRSGTVPATNDGGEPKPGKELRRGSSVERATVPYAGELDKLAETYGGLNQGVPVGLGDHSAHSTLFGVKDSGIGRGGVHNGVVGHGASK